ncbi:uncharacterized protein [Antedon mediterranea]
MEHLSDHSANNDDEYAGTDDDIPPEPQELPTLDIDIGSGTQDPTEEGDIGAILDAHAANTGAKQTQVRAKRVVRNPQPKLDPARLSGERGLPTLVKHMEHVKFKGKGYEKDDLNLLMHRMEHWTHRLCPRMTFDEVIARIEKLGSKKPVQVCVKKIRLDIPLLDDDEPVQNMETVEDSNAPSGEKTPEKDEWNFDDLFADKLVAKPISTPVIPAQDEFDELFADSQTNHQPMNIPQTPSTPQSTSNTLTAEQLKRIEEKRNLAVRRKAARMAQERAEQNQLSQEGKTTERENGSQQIDEDIIEIIDEQNQLSQEPKTKERENGSQKVDEDIIEIIDEQNQLTQEGKTKERENGSQKVDEDIIEIIDEQNQLSQEGKTNKETSSKELDEDLIEIMDEAEKQTKFNIADDDDCIVENYINLKSSCTDEVINID